MRDDNPIMKDAMHLSLMECMMQNPDMEYRDAALRVVQVTLAGMIQAMLITTSAFRAPENMNVLGFADGITQMLDFVCDINERIGKENGQG